MTSYNISFTVMYNYSYKKYILNSISILSNKHLSTKTYIWHKIADSAAGLNFPLNNLLQIQVAGKTICIAKKEESLFACTAKCPHAGGILADGFMDALGNLVCPLHRYKFNIQNGRNTSGEGYYLKTFPVQIRAEGIFVGFEESSFWGWLK